MLIRIDQRRIMRNHLIHNTLYERTVAAVRAELDAEEFAAAWAGGRTLPLEQAVAAQEDGARDRFAPVRARRL
jgi:hypothetical protein